MYTFVIRAALKHGSYTVSNTCTPLSLELPALKHGSYTISNTCTPLSLELPSNMVATLSVIHDVIGDVERKKERKTPEEMEK